MISKKSNRTGLYKCVSDLFKNPTNINKKTIVIFNVSGQKYKNIISTYHLVKWNSCLVKKLLLKCTINNWDCSIKWHNCLCIHVDSLKMCSTEIISLSASVFWRSSKDAKHIGIWMVQSTCSKKILNVKQACKILRFLYLSLFHAWNWSRQVLTRLRHVQGLFSFSLMTFRVIFRHWRWH